MITRLAVTGDGSRPLLVSAAVFTITLLRSALEQPTSWLSANEDPLIT